MSRENRDEMTWVRLTAAERRTLENAALRARKPLSTWMREIALNAAIESKALHSLANDATVDMFDQSFNRRAWRNAG